MGPVHVAKDAHSSEAITCAHDINGAQQNLDAQKPGLIGLGFIVSLQNSKAAARDLHRH